MSQTGVMKDGHKMFLQAFMSRGILNGPEVRQLYKYACERFGEPHNEEDLPLFVSCINNNIKPLSIEIRKGISEENGSHFYGLINTAESAITKFASDYTASELELFQVMIRFIVESESGSISSTDILNQSGHLERKMKKDEAQDFLFHLERDKWIFENSGEISLSTRAVMELDNYIRETYPDMATSCNVCNRLCLKGHSCNICDVKLHRHCAARLFRDQQNPACPGEGCGANWPHQIPQKDGKSKSSSHTDDTSSRKRKTRQ